MARGGFRGGYGGMNQANMMKQAQKMQQDFLRMQKELEEKEFTAKAGGGINTIKPMIILSARVRFNTLPNTLILFMHLSSNKIIYCLKLIEV